jgi:hypothetical protein
MTENAQKSTWAILARDEAIFWVLLGTAGSLGGIGVVELLFIGFAVGSLIAAVVLLKKQK